MMTQALDPVIAEINARLGRPLRVLHIGNIANNAYNNARIQRQYGIDADVLCYDYYHVMATPEWEDGGLTTTIDPDLPNWWESNLKGSRRPDWYVQGPLALCLEYLDLRRRGQEVRRLAAASSIENAYVEMLRSDAAVRNRPWRDTRPFSRRYPAFLHFPNTLRGNKGSAMSLVDTVLRAPYGLSVAVDAMRRLVLWPLLAGAVAEPPRIAGARAVLGLYRLMRRCFGREERDALAIARQAAEFVPKDTTLTWAGCFSRFARLIPRSLMHALFSLAAIPAHVLWGRHKPNKSPPIRERRARAAAIAARLTGDMEPLATPEQHAALASRIAGHALLFGPVLKHYDIIQGYSIDGFIPLVNGHGAFASYEHGTLRALPFEDSLTGLICRIAYRHSPAVFVTNTDVLPSVERLGLAHGKVHYLPHAFDDRKLMQWRDARPELAPPAEDVVFFSPTRQHWRDANRSLVKGNDIMLRAAGRLWAEGRRFRLVMVEWGHNITETKRMIEGLGYAEAVTWVPPMGKQDLWRAYCTSHAVLDQFVLPALGGVAFETLALGCRLITRTDQQTLTRFFGAAPPVLPAGSVEEVESSMRAVLDDPEDKAGLGPAGRSWIDDWHSARRTVSIQAETYRHLLALEPQSKLADSSLRH
jgi:glycosyltransferase involved in cell wall biosynthesis